MEDVVIWSKPMCSYCEQSKKLLAAKGISYEERIIGNTHTKEELLEAVPNARSVPQIFIKGEHIGGFTELQQHLKSVQS